MKKGKANSSKNMKGMIQKQLDQINQVLVNQHKLKKNKKNLKKFLKKQTLINSKKKIKKIKIKKLKKIRF